MKEKRKIIMTREKATHQQHLSPTNNGKTLGTVLVRQSLTLHRMGATLFYLQGRKEDIYRLVDLRVESLIGQLVVEVKGQRA